MMKEVPFKIGSPSDLSFSNVLDIYGIPKNMPKKKERPEINLNIKKHDNPFKPSSPPKEGLQGCIGKFPKYMGDPLKVTEKRVIEKGDHFKYFFINQTNS